MGPFRVWKLTFHYLWDTPFRSWASPFLADLISPRSFFHDFHNHLTLLSSNQTLEIKMWFLAQPLFLSLPFCFPRQIHYSYLVRGSRHWTLLIYASESSPSPSLSRVLTSRSGTYHSFCVSCQPLYLTHNNSIHSIIWPVKSTQDQFTLHHL